MSHKLYGRNYIYVYISALAIITANIFLTNVFLNNQFLTYPLNLFKFGEIYKDRLFPKMSKCIFYRYLEDKYLNYLITSNNSDTDHLELWQRLISYAFYLLTSSMKKYISAFSFGNYKSVKYITAVAQRYFQCLFH